MLKSRKIFQCTQNGPHHTERHRKFHAPRGCGIEERKRPRRAKNRQGTATLNYNRVKRVAPLRGVWGAAGGAVSHKGCKTFTGDSCAPQPPTAASAAAYNWAVPFLRLSRALLWGAVAGTVFFRGSLIRRNTQQPALAGCGCESHPLWVGDHRTNEPQ